MSTERVLVVDDELFVRELLDEYFSKLKFSVDVAESGEAALELVSENHYQVALVDLKMTGLDGLATLKRIREIDAEVVLILMTGYPTVESSIDSIRAGVYDYIVKPFRLNELKDLVTGAIKEYEVRREMIRMKHKIDMLEAYLQQADGDFPRKFGEFQKKAQDSNKHHSKSQTGKMSVRGKMA